MELAPHIRRIGNDIIAVHLIVTDEGITVIDAGLAGHWRDLVRELEAMGRTLDDVKGVILTHGDSDHVGFAERLRREDGVPVYVHEADAARAKGAKPPKTGRQHMHVAPTIGFFWYSLRKGGLRTTALTEVVEMRGGETLPLPGAPRDHRTARALAGKHRGARSARPGGVRRGCPDHPARADGRGGAAAGTLHRRSGCRGPLARRDRRSGRGLGDPGARRTLARQPAGARRRDPRPGLSRELRDRPDTPARGPPPGCRTIPAVVRGDDPGRARGPPAAGAWSPAVPA